MILSIMLPWPPRELSPNYRAAHWSAISKAKKRYRAACFIQAREQGAKAMQTGPLDVALIFHPPDRRHRDWDNMIASMKAGLDGLADAIRVDDKHWRLSFQVSDQTGGFVRVGIKAATVDSVEAALRVVGVVG